MTEKRNIFLIGPMGAGKSTVGRCLAQELRRSFFDSDEQIEKETGADISWIFELEGEEGFRQREERIIKQLTEKKSIVLATGGGAIVSKEIRHALAVGGIVIYLATTIEKQLSRTNKEPRRPLLDNYTSHREALEALAKERGPLYQSIADLTVNTDNQNAKTLASFIINALSLS